MTFDWLEIEINKKIQEILNQPGCHLVTQPKCE